MIKKPLISVIVPVFNAEKYLNRCINSIVNQSYDNLEIILINDGSPDNCPTICDEWAKKDKRIKVFHQANKGAYSARNKGLDLANGSYIGFVDADDYISANMYSELLNLIVTYNAEASGCAIVRESLNGYCEDWSDGSLIEFNKIELQKWIGEAQGLVTVHIGNKLFSSKCIQSIRFNNYKYAEDVLFNFKISQNINKFVLKSEPLYHYINNTDSISHIEFDENRFDEHLVMDEIFLIAKENPEVLSSCIKGDIIKSFRTIKEMCISGNCLNRFEEIRKRIIIHKSEILHGNFYSTVTKIKTIILWLMPRLYVHLIKLYGKYANKKYNRNMEK